MPCLCCTPSGSLVLAYVLSCIGKQGYVTCSLDGHSKPALVLGTGSGLSPTLDLAAVCQETPEGRYILVVDLLALFQAERADLASSSEAATPIVSPGSLASRWPPAAGPT